MKKLRRKIKIENATTFKLEYYEGESEIKSKEFTSYKAMEQFHNRQTSFMYLDLNRYAFVNNQWHRFIKLQSPFVFHQDLDFINKIFNEKVEVENLQNFKSEEKSNQIKTNKKTCI